MRIRVLSYYLFWLLRSPIWFFFHNCIPEGPGEGHFCPGVSRVTMPGLWHRHNPRLLATLGTLLRVPEGSTPVSRLSRAPTGIRNNEID